jgi:virginiamycin B lyase
MRLRGWIAVLLAAAFAGCGGAGLSTLPSGGGTDAPARERAERAEVHMRIVIPRRHPGRGAHYISPSTRSLAISVLSSKGVTTNHSVNLTPATNPNCKAGGCSIAFSLAVGAYTFTLEAFDGLLDASGHPTGHVLSAHFSVPVTILKGRLNTIGVTLDGIATSVALVPSPSSVLVGSGAAFALSKCYSHNPEQRTQSVNVIGVDADGNYILAAGAPSASLTTDDGVHLAVTEAAPTIPQAFTLTDPTGALPNPHSAVHLTAKVTPAAESHGVAVSSLITVTFDASICGVFTAHVLPSPDSFPIGLTVGSDGALWFAEELGNRVGRMTTSGAFTEYPTSGSPYGIANGPENTIWFTQWQSNQVGQIATSGGTVYESHVPTASAGVYNIASDPRGGFPWFTETQANNIDTLRETGLGFATVRESPVTTASAQPWGIAAGPDGAMWFTEQCGNKIGRFSGSVTNEFPIPTTLSSPQQIASGPDGNLWFTETGVHQIGRITTGGTITEYPIPTSTSIDGIAAGPDGAMYFVETGAQKIGRITTTGVVTEMAIPGYAGNPAIIVLGPDNAMWFTQSFGNAIVRLQ